MSLSQSKISCNAFRTPERGRSATSVKQTTSVRGGPRSCLNVEVKSPPLRLNEKVPSDKTKEVMDMDSKYIVGTYARAPLVLVKGIGCKLYDIDGREFLDLTSGIAVNALGHGDSDWFTALADQAKTLNHVSNIYCSVQQVKPLL